MSHDVRVLIGQPPKRYVVCFTCFGLDSGMVDAGTARAIKVEHSLRTMPQRWSPNPPSTNEGA